MTFEISGRVQESHLITGVFELYDQGFVGLSLVVLGASIVFPLMKILGLLYVLLPLRLHRQLWQAPLVFKYIELVTPWAMMEVYMLGVFVAYVKLIDMATIVLGTALYAFTALIVVLAAAGSTLDPDEVWKKLETTR
jgi:paraquat-inducible protein A